MTAIEALQEWYLSQCNGGWEHTYGVEIGTLDNPGWSFKVDLTDTHLETADFTAHSYGIGENSEPNNPEWLVCKVEKGQFVSYGGPRKLEEMISMFLSWAGKNT